MDRGVDLDRRVWGWLDERVVELLKKSVHLVKYLYSIMVEETTSKK